MNWIRTMILVSVVAACSQTDKGPTASPSNVSSTISSDVNKLGKLLDFGKHKPAAVKFKYTVIDNSGNNKRVSVPGPSDYSLEALLYFDTLTFQKFIGFDRTADFPPPGYNKEAFKFDWLDKQIVTELDSSDADYTGHPDLHFGTTIGKCWYLQNKILIYYHTN